MAKVSKDFLLVLEIVAPTNLAVAAIALKGAKHQWPGAWWPIIGIAFQAAVLYLSKSATALAEDNANAARAAEAAARAAEVTAKASEVAAIQRYKNFSAGSIARLLKARIEGEDHKLLFQAQVLGHAVDVVKDVLGLQRYDESISATWCVPIENFTKWKVTVYDRDMPNRLPGHVRDLREGVPGAAQAFLTGADVFVEDTRKPEIAQWFKQRPYESILSVPALVVNLSCKGDIELDGQQNKVIGVLNVDCTRAGVLRAELSEVLHDIAYVIALCEHLHGGEQ